MRENFLHYIWKYLKFDQRQLQSNAGESIIIGDVGTHNFESGPDFLNAKILIDQLEWIGHVEIHLRSSHWILHAHDQDPAYDNVVLHVVWEHDAEVHTSAGHTLPTLELKQLVSPVSVTNYERLFERKRKSTNCENQVLEVEKVTIDNWLTKLAYRRFERQKQMLQFDLQKEKMDWEAVCFKWLMRRFGSKVNGLAFLSIAESFPFVIFRKYLYDQELLEALLYGQGNLLKEAQEDEYVIALRNQYAFLKHKHQLKNFGVERLRWFRLRPVGFPTIRLAQLAALYHKRITVFRNMLDLKSASEAYNFFGLKASAYWDHHFRFGKKSPKQPKLISQALSDQLFIHVVLPFQQLYAELYQNSKSLDPMAILSGMRPESNKYVQLWKPLGVQAENALQSIGLAELSSNYCDRNNCISCKIGHEILDRNT